MGGSFSFYRARIAIAEGIGEWNSVRVDAHIIHGPAIDSNGTNSLRGEAGTLA